MLLNKQIKKEMPYLSIQERSEQVTSIWSGMSKNERDLMRLQGETEWVCNPKRKEKPPNMFSFQDSVGNARSILSTSIPFVQFPLGPELELSFAHGTENRDTLKNHTEVITSNLQILRKVVAEELSHESSEISIDEINRKLGNKWTEMGSASEINRKVGNKRKEMGSTSNNGSSSGSGSESVTINNNGIDKINRLNKKIREKRSRLRAFSGKQNNEWTGSGEEIFDRALQEIEVEILKGDWMKKK